MPTVIKMQLITVYRDTPEQLTEYITSEGLTQKDIMCMTHYKHEWVLVCWEKVEEPKYFIALLPKCAQNAAYYFNLDLDPCLERSLIHFFTKTQADKVLAIIKKDEEFPEHHVRAIPAVYETYPTSDLRAKFSCQPQADQSC